MRAAGRLHGGGAHSDARRAFTLKAAGAILRIGWIENVEMDAFQLESGAGCHCNRAVHVQREVPQCDVTRYTERTVVPEASRPRYNRAIVECREQLFRASRRRGQYYEE